METYEFKHISKTGLEVEENFGHVIIISWSSLGICFFVCPSHSRTKCSNVQSIYILNRWVYDANGIIKIELFAIE